MKSFGERLKLEREKRAITLEQISNSTKIGTRMLQALESENFDQLPGGIFNKGFVRAYARHVGLDEDQAVADYLEASGQNSPAGDAVLVAEEPEPPPAPARRMPLGWAAAGLLTVAVTLTLWSRWHRQEPEQAPAPAAAQPEATSASVAAKSPASVVPNPISSPSTAPSKQPDNPAPAPTPPSPTNLLPGTSTGEFTVVIRAQEESWVSIQVDDSPALEDTLIAGTQRAIHARKQVLIKAGNTGALDFVFNGKKLPSQGDYGEVKTLTFSGGGLQPLTSAPPKMP